MIDNVLTALVFAGLFAAEIEWIMRRGGKG